MKTASSPVNGPVNGADLVLTRTLKAPIDDVWASLTSSKRTALWFGPWEGEAAPGKTIQVRMVHEQGAPRVSARFDRCSAPAIRHLRARRGRAGSTASTTSLRCARVRI